MKYLLDTGILLRLVHPADPQHPSITGALALLKSQGHSFYCALQNIAEFWNTSTRPIVARGGFGLSHRETRQRLDVIERAVEVLTDTPACYHEWKQLVSQHVVLGVQVHDARLVALMNVHGIQHLLTLDVADFRRYAQLTVATPSLILASPS
jgi:predicted nucleic acid-binding protein